MLLAAVVALSTFLSTLSLRRATISAQTRHKRSCISIHALLAESDHNAHMSGTLRPAFLSTLSLRRATGYTAEYIERCEHFYPRSPCGERQFYVVTIFLMFQFLSTLSLRRATTGKTGSRVLTKYFYPRSPCGERQRQSRLSGRVSYFYPRSPCGERRLSE